eukprot:6511892-Prymnesium_polylepis.1
MPCHVPHAVVSLVRTSPCACAHLPAVASLVRTSHLRLCPLACPMCASPPSGTHVSTPELSASHS